MFALSLEDRIAQGIRSVGQRGKIRLRVSM